MMQPATRKLSWFCVKAALFEMVTKALCNVLQSLTCKRATKLLASYKVRILKKFKNKDKEPEMPTNSSSYFVLPSSKLCSLFLSSASLSSNSLSLSASMDSYISSLLKSTGDRRDRLECRHLEERPPLPLPIKVKGLSQKF